MHRGMQMRRIFFAPAMNQPLILDATEMYHDLTGDIRPLFKLFKWYMRCHEPRLFHEAPGTNLAALRGKSKLEFFSEFLPLAESPELFEKKIAELQEMLPRAAF
jgi:hypothetical protein